MDSARKRVRFENRNLIFMCAKGPAECRPFCVEGGKGIRYIPGRNVMLVNEAYVLFYGNRISSRVI